MLIWGDRVEPRWHVKVQAYIFGIIYILFINLLKPTVKKPGELVSGDRILYYSLHRDLIPVLLASGSLRDILWISNNSRGGYAATMVGRACGIDVFRYSCDGFRSPFEQVQSFLDSYPGAVAIFTDAGRRDGKVRASLIGLARQSERPLVPIRIQASRSRQVNRQAVPLPLCKITIAQGAPIWIPPECAEAGRDSDLHQQLQRALADLDQVSSTRSLRWPQRTANLLRQL